MSSESEIYFNDFKVPYNERFDNEMAEEVYTLNSIDFSALVQEFMG